MDCSENNCSSCISEVLKRILILQKKDFECGNYVGCDKPFLGPTVNNVCYNTRPIQLFICCNGNPWTFSYTLDGTTYTSNILRVEALDDCCCTCRILHFDTETSTYVSTDEYVTIDLNCCGAIRCLSDISIDLC